MRLADAPLDQPLFARLEFRLQQRLQVSGVLVQRDRSTRLPLVRIVTRR